MAAMPFSVDGVELDLRMRNFEFFNFVSSYAFDSLRPLHLKATGKIKFQGKVNKMLEGDEIMRGISGDVSISGLKLNQLMLAPHLVGVLNMSSKSMKVFLSALFPVLNLTSILKVVVFDWWCSKFKWSRHLERLCHLLLTCFKKVQLPN